MTTYFVVILVVYFLASFSQTAARAPAVPTRSSRFATTTKSQVGPSFSWWLAVLAGAVLIAVSALRWRRGTDYWQYEAGYEQYIALPWAEMRPLDEPGIRIVAKVGQLFHDDPTSMFALAALITVGLTTWTIYRSTSNYALALVLYIISTSWQGSFNGVRQYIACAILFAGHRLILQRRFLPYATVVCLATTFHLSALVFLLLYWMPRRKLGPIAIVMMLGASLVLLNSYELVGELIDTVQDDDISSGTYFAREINIWRIVLALAPLVMYAMFTSRDELSDSGHFYVNMMFLHAAVMISSANSAYIARFSLYTAVYISLALPAMLNMKNKTLRALLVLAVVAGYGMYWYLETSTISALNPYQSVFGR